MPSFDPADLSDGDVYVLLTSLVVPRPIAWVSTLSSEGTGNLAPHSYFNVISSAPPIVHFTSSGAKDTLTNVRATGEFVVNVVSVDLLDQMNATSARWEAHLDEFDAVGLERAPSATVSPPRVAAAPAALECTVRTILSMGNGNMVFGDVRHIWVADRVWSEGQVDIAALAPVARLSGSQYMLPTAIVERARPRTP